MDPKRRFDSGPRLMDNRTPPPEVIPTQNGEPLPMPLPPSLQKLVDHLTSFGTRPQGGRRIPIPLTPAERAAKLAKRAERKRERDRKRDQRRKNRR